MRLIDMHCDTLSKLYHQSDLGDLFDNVCEVNIKKLQMADSMVQFFACFTCFQDYLNYDLCYQDVLSMIAYFEKQEEKYGDKIQKLLHGCDMENNWKNDKVSALLTVEEGGVLNGESKRLEELYQKGIRLITLTWNYENCLGHPNSRDPKIMEKGLKPFGREVVERMEELGMIVDLSHSSDGTFWDVLDMAKKPVVASHSCCRSLCPHPRNLSDEMIRHLAENGGICGLNFYGAFLGTPAESRVEEMTAHILHMIRYGGSDFPAIGTDFDGFDGMNHMDIPDISFMERLWGGLKKKGLSEEQLDRIWNKNAMRILQGI